MDAYLQMYNRELSELKCFMPDEVVTRGNAIKHSSFLNHYIGKGSLKDCYQDLIDICRTDIYVTLGFYLRYLSENALNKDSYFKLVNYPSCYGKVGKTTVRMGALFRCGACGL